MQEAPMHGSSASHSSVLDTQVNPDGMFRSGPVDPSEAHRNATSTASASSLPSKAQQASAPSTSASASEAGNLSAGHAPVRQVPAGQSSARHGAEPISGPDFLLIGPHASKPHAEAGSGNDSSSSSHSSPLTKLAQQPQQQPQGRLSVQSLMRTLSGSSGRSSGDDASSRRDTKSAIRSLGSRFDQSARGVSTDQHTPPHKAKAMASEHADESAHARLTPLKQNFISHLTKVGQASGREGLIESGDDDSESVDFMETAMEQELSRSQPQHPQPTRSPSGRTRLGMTRRHEPLNDTESARRPCDAWDSSDEDSYDHFEPAASHPRPHKPSDVSSAHHSNSFDYMPNRNLDLDRNLGHSHMQSASDQSQRSQPPPRFQPPPSMSWMQRSSACELDRLSDIPESPQHQGSPMWQPNPLSEAEDGDTDIEDRNPSARMGDMDIRGRQSSARAPQHVWQGVNPLSEAEDEGSDEEEAPFCPAQPQQQPDAAFSRRTQQVGLKVKIFLQCSPTIHCFYCYFT